MMPLIVTSLCFKGLWGSWDYLRILVPVLFFSLGRKRVNLNNYLKLPMETFQIPCFFYPCIVGNNVTQCPGKR